MIYLIEKTTVHKSGDVNVNLLRPWYDTFEDALYNLKVFTRISEKTVNATITYRLINFVEAGAPKQSINHYNFDMIETKAALKNYADIMLSVELKTFTSPAITNLDFNEVK
jgi:hypothetical protein